MSVTKRDVLIAAGAVVVAAGALFEGPRLFAKHYPPTPYDDLLALLDNRENAVQLGKAVLTPGFEAKKAAAVLRARLKTETLSAAMAADEATGRLLEARGWVYPETLALLCALAATTA